jgi:anti-anti-sigma factor
LLDLYGNLTVGENEQLLKDTVADLISREHTKVIVNLGNVEFVDSSGIGALVKGYTSATNAGGRLKLLSPGKMVRQTGRGAGRPGERAGRPGRQTGRPGGRAGRPGRQTGRPGGRAGRKLFRRARGRAASVLAPAAPGMRAGRRRAIRRMGRSAGRGAGPSGARADLPGASPTGKTCLRKR